MSNQPRFLPPEGKPEFHLASTDGHSCVIYQVSPEDNKPGTIIPERFRKLAVGEGCGVVGLDFNAKADAGANKTDLIVAAIGAVLDRQQADELEGDGRPKVAAVGKQAGFKVTKTQFDAAWPQYVDSLGTDDDSDDQDD
jgi:hypothetical protein